MNPYEVGAVGAPAEKVERHHGVSIASVIVSALAVLSFVGAFVYMVVRQSQGAVTSENDYLIAGAGVFGAAIFSVLGLALGVIGLLIRSHKRLLAFVGTTVSGIMVMAIVGLAAIGLKQS